MTSDTISQLKLKGLLSMVSKANNENRPDTNCPWLEIDCVSNTNSASAIQDILKRLEVAWSRDDDMLLILLLETISRVIL